MLLMEGSYYYYYYLHHPVAKEVYYEGREKDIQERKRVKKNKTKQDESKLKRKKTHIKIDQELKD